MDLNPRLYVEIHPFDGPHSPHPHPIHEGHFDPDYFYKVLGMYNPSETSECYFMLANPQRQIWFIPAASPAGVPADRVGRAVPAQNASPGRPFAGPAHIHFAVLTRNPG